MTPALQGLHTHFRTKGSEAFHAGRSRDSHGLNYGSDAITDFYIGYDAAARTSPTSHIAPLQALRFAMAQGRHYNRLAALAGIENRIPSSKGA